MAIFDSNKKMYLTYYCQLNDPVAVDTTVNPVPTAFPSGAETTIKALQTAFPHGMNAAPLLAASLLHAPFRGYSDPGNAPTTWAPWNSFGNDDGPYPIDTSKFRRHTGGFLGIGGTTVDYYWMGEFVEAPSDGTDGDVTDTAGVPVAPGSISEFPLRHFLEGFECPGLGIGQSGATSGLVAGVTISPDASRHVGGLGLALRGPNNEKFAISIATPPKTKIWNRLYVRLRKAPTTQVVDFWRYTGASVQVGFILSLNPNRTLTIWSADAAGTRTLQHQSSLALCEVWDGNPANAQTWVRLDILAITAGSTSIRVYKNGVLFATATGVAAGAFINTVVVGNAVAQVNDMYMDLDDWISADIPERPVATENLTGIDFRQGSKIARLSPQAFSGSHAAGSWTTDFRSLMARGLALTAPSGQVTGSVSGAVLAVDTDSALSVDSDAGTIGLIAIEVIAESNSSDGSDGSLGFKLAAGAPIMTVIPEIPAFTVNRAMYTVTPTVTPAGQAPTLPDSTPIELRYVKAASVATAVIRSLQAQVELIGVYGPEDNQDQSTGASAFEAQSVGCHNLPYKYSPWSRLGKAAPIAPYIVKSGTYVGNGTGQDLTFRAPVNWLYIRPLAANTGGTAWWSSMIGCVKNFKEAIEYDLVDAQEDPTFIGAPGQDAQQQRYRVRLGGNDDQNNQAAITYWYVAVSDPGMRYMLNGVMNHDDSVATYDNLLVVPNYLADWAFIFSGDDSLVATRRLYGKGPGNAAATIVNFDSSLGALAAALTFGIGKLTTQTAFHALGSAGGNYYPFALWRKQDGNRDTGEPKVVNIGTYTGDGSASRTINLTPAAGVRPLFAMFFAESGASRGYHRDTQHTGTNSSLYTGVENATGITAGGIDQISVGSSLNVAGVIYNYFVLWAGITAGNNGWGTDGEYAPVEPAPPVGGPWPPDPEPIDTVDYVPPAVPLPGEPDIDTGTILSDSATMIWGQVGGFPCETYTRALVNRAFKHLGISKRIADLNADVTEAGYTARDNVREVMNQVLRDFPWPFATQYSNLVLVGGTATVAVNKDWQYSYRAPNQMMLARRIVSQTGTQRAHDPDPIKFRISTDATGVLVFCNEAIPTAGTLVLEWTKRLNCPAFYGDPLFREAVAWKLAASMAMPLARDTKKEAFCLGMYRQSLWNAATPASNEQQQEPEGDAPWIEGRG